MTTISRKNSVPWFLWPFWALWKLVTGILILTGRFAAVIIGLVLILAGDLLSLTIIGAIIGVPLLIIGLLLVFRGLF